MIWMWIGFIAVRARDAGARPGRLPPQGPRRVDEGGARLVGGLDRARPLVQRLRLLRLREPLARPRHDVRPDGGQRRPTRQGLNDGAQATVKYLTGYLVEKSLSVDNIFVIAMIFGFFAVPAIYQHRVLFWGILGALVMRGVMIAVGAALLREFSWIIYVFGGFLILTGVKMLLLKDDETDPNDNVDRPADAALLPVTERYHGQHFFVRAGAPRLARGGDARQPARGRDRVVEAAKPGRAARDAAVPRAGHGRVHRPDLRRRLDPGDLRDHDRPVPRLHQQRVRDPRPAQPLLRARRA